MKAHKDTFLNIAPDAFLTPSPKNKNSQNWERRKAISEYIWT